MADPGEYLPGIYEEFRERYPAVASAQDALAREMAAAAPFDERTVRLLKLALAVGAQSEGRCGLTLARPSRWAPARMSCGRWRCWR